MRLVSSKKNGANVAADSAKIRQLHSKLNRDVSSARKRVRSMQKKLKHSEARAADLANAVEKYKQNLKVLCGVVSPPPFFVD